MFVVMTVKFRSWRRSNGVCVYMVGSLSPIRNGDGGGDGRVSIAMT